MTAGDAVSNEDNPARRTSPRRIAIALAVGTAIAVVAVAIVLATRSTNTGTPINSPQVSGRPVGSPLPVNFQLQRLGGGQPVSLARLVRGHPAVINLFASWCTACQQELDSFGTVSEQLANKVDFVGIDTSETDPARSIVLLGKARVRYPVALDSSSSTVADDWGVDGLPVTFFVRANGTIAEEYLGAVSSTTLSKEARALLGS